MSYMERFPVTWTGTGHKKPINGALELRDGRILSWSDDHTLLIRSASGQPTRVLGALRTGSNPHADVWGGICHFYLCETGG